MKTIHRLTLRSCFVAAAFTLLGLTPAFAQNWIMDAQADLTITTSFDCSSIAKFIPAPDGGTYLLNNPVFFGEKRLERIRRLDSSGKTDAAFNYTLPQDFWLEGTAVLQDGSLVVLLAGMNETHKAIRLSKTGNLLRTYEFPDEATPRGIATLSDGNLAVWAKTKTAYAGWIDAIYVIRVATDVITRLDCPWLHYSDTISAIRSRGKGGLWIEGSINVSSQVRHLVAMTGEGLLDDSFQSTVFPLRGDAWESVAELSDGSLAIIIADPYSPRLVHLNASGLVDTRFDGLPINHPRKISHLAPGYLVLEVRNQVSDGHPFIKSQVGVYDDTRATVLVLSEDGRILRNLNADLPLDWDVLLAGCLGNGSMAVRQGPAVRSLIRRWEVFTYQIAIPSPTIAWVLPESGARGLIPDLRQTKAGTVQTYLPDGHGGLFLQGDFTSINGSPRPGLAHLLADGSLDPNFRDSATTPYQGSIQALMPDGSFFFVSDETAPVDGPEHLNRDIKLLRHFSALGQLDTRFQALEFGANRPRIITQGRKGYLASFFNPDYTDNRNLKLQWLDSTGTPVGAPSSAEFSGVARAEGIEPSNESRLMLENTLVRAINLPNGRFAVFSGPSSFPSFILDARTGFTGVDGQPVPGFFFMDENLVPDHIANARLNGIMAVDYASLNLDGTIQLNTWDTTLGRLEITSFGIFQDGSRDPRYPAFAPTTGDRILKPASFIDLAGQPVAASHIIQENERSIWSLSPFAHYHRNSDPGLITLEPFQQAVALHQRATIMLVGDNPLTPSCQWFHNGALMPGQTNPYLSIPTASPSDAGEYRVEFTHPITGVPLVRLAHLSVTPPDTGLLNISARASVSPSLPLILGLSLQSASPRKLLARAIGRGLADYWAPPPLLGDSILSVYGPAGLIQSKSDGITDPGIVSLSNLVGAFPITASSSSQGSALAPSLGTGVYSVLTQSIDGSTGTALSEVYLTEPSDLPTGALRNLSARGYLDSAENPFIVGLVVGGKTPLHVLLRAIGPELANFGIKDAIADPIMDLRSDHPSYSFTLSNDNWNGETATAGASRQVGAFEIPANSKDSAMVLYLDPGIYTVVVHNGNNTPGTVLVEAYVLE